MILNEHGIWYEVPDDDAISYNVIDPVTGDSKLVYCELGETCTLPGTLLDVHQQDQGEALLREIFGDA